MTSARVKVAPLVVRDAAELDSADAAEIFASDLLWTPFSAPAFARRSARFMPLRLPR